MLRQRTIKTAVHAIGVGVHSAKKVRMTLRPAGENTGILFTRTDSKRAGALKATVYNVSDTTLSTSIGQNDFRVSTVEHLMSALWGLGVDNLVVELSGEEVPIMDGSAAPFIYLINSVGVVEQAAAKKYIRIKKEISVQQGDSLATLKPFAGFKAGYTFVADHPVYNRFPKRAELDFSKVSYVEQVSRARSFGLMNELEQAQKMNKCLGSSLQNAVGVNDFNVVNPEGLRYVDEFAKHKLLDAIGDLYLLGSPVIGEFDGYKSGHAMNNQLARKLLETQDAFEMITLTGRDRGVVRHPILQPATVG